MSRLSHCLSLAYVLLCTILFSGLATSPAHTANPSTQKTSSAGDSSTMAQLEFASSRSRRAHPAANSQPGQFDFYLLTLSWSPEYCATHSSSECPLHRGLVVHGMWPQNNDGTYPENCSKGVGPANPQQHLDLIPTVSLINHEWATHGTCSGIAPDAYFSAIRSAFQSIKIPSALVDVTKQEMLAPSAIIRDFATANPTWPSGSIALGCGNNYLTAVEVCLSKSLQVEPCQNVHSCGARVVTVTPQ